MRRAGLRLAGGAAGVLVLLAAAVLVNTFVLTRSRQVEVPPAPVLAVDERAAAESLGTAIRARTVSTAGSAETNVEAFRSLHEHLAARYPKVHATLQREIVGGQSLLFTWTGSEPKAPGIALMAHQDVVPIAPGTEDRWQTDPFAGTVRDGFVWGRGAWDDKANLIAQLEAVEALLAAGFQPRRTVYLVFGADEEVGGLRGAKAIAGLLAQRGVRLDLVVDEGLLITDGVMPGLKPPAALIGIAEKGFLSVVLKVPATPGHSSMPPPKGTGAIAMMSAALARLEDRQLPASIQGVARQMFETLAPEISGFSRIALSNLWLFGPLVQRQLEGAASTNAMLRTTTALTVVHAGNKDNVLPASAEATVNFRLLPGDSIGAVMEHVRRAAGSDRFERVALDGAAEPSRVSPVDSAAYRLVERTVRELFPGTVVAPGLMIAATDSRHFEAIADHILKFSPVRARPEDLPRFHGTDERISTTNLVELIRFYHRLIGQGAR